VESHAAAKVEDQGLLVVGGLLVALGEGRPQAGEAIGAGEIPEHQPLEDRIAEEAHSLESVVRHAGGGRDVGGGHGDAQNLGPRRQNEEQQTGQRSH
jgi:hypothetical protein